MNDELFMRQWNAGHEQLSTDLDHALARLRRALPRSRRTPHSIGGAYANSGLGESPPDQAMRHLLGGLAAVGTTTALFLTVALLAVPGTASPQGAPIQAAAGSQPYLG